MQIYGLKTCDTCRKALKALPEAQLVDIRETPIDPVLLDHALERFGTALINMRSTTWRNLDPAGRAADPRVLIKAHPAVMKRPLIVRGEAMHLGWGAETRAALGAA